MFTMKKKEYVTLKRSGFPNVYRVTGRKLKDILLESIDGSEKFNMSYYSVEEYYELSDEELPLFLIKRELLK